MRHFYRDRCQEQIREMFRLSAEAEASARLLRQEAVRYQRILEDDSLSEDSLRELALGHDELRVSPDKLVRVTEGLM